MANHVIVVATSDR